MAVEETIPRDLERSEIHPGSAAEEESEDEPDPWDGLTYRETFEIFWPALWRAILLGLPPVLVFVLCILTSGYTPYRNPAQSITYPIWSTLQYASFTMVIVLVGWAVIYRAIIAGCRRCWPGATQRFFERMERSPGMEVVELAGRKRKERRRKEEERRRKEEERREISGNVTEKTPLLRKSPEIQKAESS
ncbi:hypothetical protein P152DRAFT_106403 [Eremomyces bilateralis CBS 781.70]|uniref:Uncharacterized protein n=1 Tax=Eremomyces bilateralis CBS 781.70 TaxID=1392243 RepID=A0A6G1FWJ8_9PEZI|nr:uncharacterized protein P152DRAFT_106403 [Eremomyces bilateralis CBS 781.70]KAF1810265.1 hypothetical protein P152DRAFT_106403 [Eremomyces bilateralis CBS 781.70]